MLKEGKVINVKTRLNVRSGAGTNYKIIGKKYNGNKLTLDNSKKVKNVTWYRIKGSGWVSGTYVKITKDLQKKGNTTSSSSKKPSTSSTKKPSTTNKPSKPSSTTVKTTGDKVQRPGSKPKSSKKSTLSMPIPLKGLTYNPKWYSSSYKITYSSDVKDSVKVIKQANHIAVRSSSSLNNSVMNFNRYHKDLTDLQLAKTFAHVYFTRPEFNIKPGNLLKTNSANNIENDAILYYLYKNTPWAVNALTSGYSSAHKFNPILSNLAKSFEPSDEYIETIEHGESLTGHKIVYGKHDIKSKTAGTFSVDFMDDRYMSVFNQLKFWERYISNVYRGFYKPSRENILNKVLDYACCCYYFLTDERDERILFWTKYYGVFPLTTPSGNLRWDAGSNLSMPKYSINFQYSFKEDLNPINILEFNNLSNSSDNTYRTDYNSASLGSSYNFHGAPFVETSETKTRINYMLRHRNKQIV